MMSEVYEWYMSILDRELESSRIVEAVLRQDIVTPEKKNVTKRSSRDHHGVDGLYYFNPSYADPQFLAKRVLGRTVSTVTPRLSRTFESLEYILPRLIRYR